MKKLLLLALISVSVIGCGQDDEKKSKPKSNYSLEDLFDTFDAEQIAQENILHVTGEDGAPIANAKVLIGYGLDNPFANNWLTTDAAGNLTLPAEWTTPLPLTVEAPGFVRSTYLGQAPQSFTMTLRFATIIPKYEINGVTLGHTPKDKDDKIDFGIVMAAFTKSDMMAFDITKVMSLESDTLTVAGYDAPVPSNVTLPKQKESYFIPITIQKPGYRLYFPRPGTQKVFAAKGQFPFEKVVDKLRNKGELHELINDFNMMGGTLKDVTVSAMKTKFDFNVNEFNFTAKKTAKAPAMASGEVMLAVSTADMNGVFLPSDIKRMTSGQSLPLSVLPGQKQLLMGVLKRQTEFDSDKPGMDRVSAGLYDFQDKMTPTMLPLIPDPRLDSMGNLILQVPQAFQGLNPSGMQTMLSEVQEITNGKEKFIFLNRLWEVYAPEWLGNVDLPEVPTGFPAAKKQRWEVSFIGSTETATTHLGPAAIETATHVTHSSLDF